mgnify:CR=1 FL=1
MPDNAVKPEKSWYARPVAALCLAAATLTIAVVVLSRAEFGPRESSSSAAISVTLKHYGVDTREMERSITIPMEDATSAIPGVKEVSSVTEYGKSRLILRLEEDEYDTTYDLVRDTVQRVYETLPQSVQKPEIASSSEGRGPVWVAAVASASQNSADLGLLLDRQLKPSLEKLPGAGEVEISGSSLPELSVLLDQDILAQSGLQSAQVSSYLASNDFISPAGMIQYGDYELRIIVDSRNPDIEALSELPFPMPKGGYLRLGQIAELSYHTRQPESLARLNGYEAIVIAIMPAGQANLPALSKAIQKETAKFEAQGLTFTVLSDTGKTIAESFASTLQAAAFGAFAVALAVLLLAGASTSISLRLTAVAAVPFVLLQSAAVLVLMGFNLDRHILAGLSTGIGAAVDAAILTSERLKLCLNARDAGASMRRLVPSLLSGAVTTIVALAPLATLDAISPGAGRTGAAIATATLSALVAAIVFIPPLAMSMAASGTARAPAVVERDTKRLPPRFARYAKKFFLRLEAGVARVCFRRAGIVLLCALLLTAGGVVSFLLLPLDPSMPVEDDAVYVHLEFEPGATMTSVDERLADWAKAVGAATGITAVQTSAKPGSGSALLSFNAKQIQRKDVRELARNTEVPGGFAWVQETDTSERSWELLVRGEEDAICREYAQKAAGIVRQLPFVSETVLNFKEGPENILVTPVPDRLALSGTSFGQVGDELRRALYGPVAYKRLDSEKEYDVRVGMWEELSATPDAIPKTILSGQNGPVLVAAVTDIHRERDTARVQRRDRRRVAGITIRGKAVDPVKAGDTVLASLSVLQLPPGYSWEFDKAAIEGAHKLAGSIWSFLAAALLVFIALAAIAESFSIPLGILSALPPSLAIPALLMVLTGQSFNASFACAFVAVAGIVVNASVLTVDECASVIGGLPSGKLGAYGIYRVLRVRLPSLLATAGTTVAGALPFLFLADQGSVLVRSLAFVTATGVTASFVAAITVVPALAVRFPRLVSVAKPTSL